MKPNIVHFYNQFYIKKYKTTIITKSKQYIVKVTKILFSCVQNPVNMKYQVYLFYSVVWKVKR